MAMGLMIPWGDIQTGRVPTIRDYEVTAKEILYHIGVHPDIFKGAAFIGSIVRGDLSAPRSDLDLVIVARDRSLLQARNIARDFRRIAADRRVHLELDVVGAHEAYFSPRLGPSYKETLRLCVPEFSAGIPLADCFRVPPGDIQQEMLEKMLFKLRSARARCGHFLNACLHLDSGSDRAIESWIESCWYREVRPLRMHVRLGRRLLWWHHGSLSHDGKKDVIEQFLGNPSFAPFHPNYREMVCLNRRYDDLLSRACDGQVKRVHYLRKVGRIVNRYFRKSIPLLRDVLGFMEPSSIRRAA